MAIRRSKKAEAIRVLGPTILRQMAKLGMTLKQTAQALGIDPVTLTAHMEADPAMREAWNQGKADGDVDLRNLQWKKARQKGAGSVAMVLHMSRHRLGEHDRALAQIELKPSDEITEFLKLIDGQSRGLPDQAAIPDESRTIDLTPEKDDGRPTGLQSRQSDSEASDFAELPNQDEIREG